MQNVKNPKIYLSYNNIILTLKYDRETKKPKKKTKHQNNIG